MKLCKNDGINQSLSYVITLLTHWGRVTHICVSKLTIITAIIWTNAGILLIWPIGTYFSEISFDIQTFSFKKIHFKMSSEKWWPFCLGPNVLNIQDRDNTNTSTRTLETKSLYDANFCHHWQHCRLSQHKWHYDHSQWILRINFSPKHRGIPLQHPMTCTA